MGASSAMGGQWHLPFLLVALATLAAVISGKEGGTVLTLGDSGGGLEETSLLSVAAGGIDVDVNGKGEGEMKSASGYAWIPNFVMKHMAQELNVGNRLACERVCDKHETCRSYSYRSRDKLCVWSIQALHYHYDWNFYTKVREMDAFGHFKHNGKYRKFDGVMYQEPGYKSYRGETVQQCQKLCDKVPKCKAFSYHESGERCLLTDAGIHYDPAFQYFEKPNAKPPPSLNELADAEKRLQSQEKSAKIAKKDRILASMRERAEKKLAREKRKEKSDKRLARMKAAYNEGYFKAKGVAAEKKLKEKSIKALRKKEVDDKNERIRSAEKDKKAKITRERKKKKEERDAKKDLLGTKEKLVKLKNKEIQTEIAKEDKVLDITKNLALTQAGFHEDVKDKNKVKLDTKLDNWKMKTNEVRNKGVAAEKVAKAGKKKLDAMQGKRKGKAKGKASMAKREDGKGEGKGEFY